MRVKSIALACVIGGCGSPTAPAAATDGAHSGTRLKLVFWETDELRVWSHTFFDVARGEACRPALQPDGVRYCMHHDDDAERWERGSFDFEPPVVPSVPPRPPLDADAALAPIARTIDATGERLVAAQDTSPDGLIYPVGPYDTSYGSECYLRRLDVTASFCWPAGVVLGAPQDFGDAACTIPVYPRVDGGAVPIVLHAGTVADASAPLSPASVAVATRFQRIDDQCVVVAAPAGTTYARESASLVPASLAREPEVDTDRRIQLRYVRAGSFRGRDLNRHLFDRDLASACELVRAPDRVTAHCLPVPTCGATVDTLSTDPSCSPTTLLLRTGCTDARPAIVGRHAIGEAVTTPVYYRPTRFTCEPLAGALAYRLGAELPLATFAAFTATVDD